MKLALHNYWRSSSSQRVRIALGLKELPYEYVAVNLLTQANLDDAYRAKNPVAKVPMLEVTEDDGTVSSIMQSLPILEYLEERWPERPILPRGNPYLRARTRALADLVCSGIQPFQNPPTLRTIKKLGADEVAWLKPWLENGLATYAALAAETAGAFSVGDTPTIADCCLVPQLASARRFGADYSQHALLVKLEERCLALPAFAAANPDQQPDAVKP